jgi:DNA repair protein RecO (recombination protein O)
VAAFECAETLLDTIVEHDFLDWAPFFVLWELGLLNELGFGLDLTRCAANGTVDDLIYVSPRTGRAVSREGGELYRDRLLVLPAFLLGRQAGATRAADLLAGLQLTAHFLTQWVLAPHDKTMPKRESG